MTIYKFKVNPALITLDGGYALEVTPEKACWLFKPLLLEKNAIFSADTKNCANDIPILEINDFGNEYASEMVRMLKYDASINQRDEAALKSVNRPASSLGTSEMSPGFCHLFKISVLKAPP